MHGDQGSEQKKCSLKFKLHLLRGVLTHPQLLLRCNLAAVTASLIRSEALVDYCVLAYDKPVELRRPSLLESNVFPFLPAF